MDQLSLNNTNSRGNPVSQLQEQETPMPALPDEVVEHILTILGNNAGLAEVCLVNRQFNRCSFFIAEKLITTSKKAIGSFIEAVESSLKRESLDETLQNQIKSWIGECRLFLKTIDAHARPLNTITLIKNRQELLSSFIKQKTVELLHLLYQKSSQSDFCSDIFNHMQKCYSENLRFKIAITISKHAIWMIDDIRKYNLKEDHRFEVVKVIAAHDARRIPIVIHSYNLGEKYRFEIAKIIASIDGREISVCIQNFKLSKEEDRFEVAKISALNDGAHTTCFFNNYNLSKEADRFEVAKIAVSQVHYGTFRHISNYNLSEERYFKLAKISVNALTGYIGSSYLSFFNLTEEHRYEMALITLALHKKAHFNIKNYDLIEEHRFEVAKYLAYNFAEERSPAISKQIQNYNLREEYRFEVAKIVAYNSGWEEILNPYNQYSLSIQHILELKLINLGLRS